MIQFIYDVSSCALLSCPPIYTYLIAQDFITLFITPMEERESMNLYMFNKPVSRTVCFIGLIIVKSVASAWL